MGFSEDFYKKYEDIVRRAGVMIREAALSDESIHKKEGLANFVTNFDIEVQRYLIQSFKQLLPEASFFGEEDMEENDKSLEGYCFYIDPIDGTTNFIFGYEHSCVSVGLAYAGEMIAGFVYNPYVDTMYKAVRGQGSYRNNQRLQMADKSISEGIVAFGCARYNEGDTDLLFAVVKELYLRSLSVRNGGSAAWDLCRVAGGGNVVYLELKLQPYDYAAASVIIQEAGGEIFQVDGSDITYDRPCSILGGSTRGCEEVRELIETISDFERTKEERRNAVKEELQRNMTMENLWEALSAFEGCLFYTAKKLEFSYRIRGNEMFVDRKTKSITKSTVEVAFRKATELGGAATGPKKLGCFGASYLYPIFVELGVIEKKL